LKDIKVEAEKVDWNGILARIVLLDAGQKRLSEEEPGNPEGWRRIAVVPVLEEFEASEKIVNVAAERFQ